MKELNQRAVRKRQAILLASAQVFATKGYHNTRMEEIAVVAGIGKGTIYEYFDSKLQLFQALLEGSLKYYYDKVDNLELEQISFQERIYLMLMAHFNFCRDNQELMRVIFWDTEFFDQELKEWAYSQRKDKEKRLIGIIRQGMDQGELAPGDPRIVAVVIMGIMGSMWVPIAEEEWDVPLDKLAETVTRLIMHGIGNSRG